MRLLGYPEQYVKSYSDTPSNPSAEVVLVAQKTATYLPYPVTKEWCERVRDALDLMPRGAYTRLAEYLGDKVAEPPSTGHLSDVLKGKYQTSDLVEPIHQFLGWSPPLPPTASLDAGELIHVGNRMTKKQRELLLAAAAQLEGESGEQARVALTEMLKAFRVRNEND